MQKSLSLILKSSVSYLVHIGDLTEMEYNIHMLFLLAYNCMKIRIGAAVAQGVKWLSNQMVQSLTLCVCLTWPTTIKYNT